MNYDQNYVILDDRLDRMLDSTLNGYFTHAYCTAGECEVCFNGQTFLFQKGDCMIIVSNRGLTEIAPSDDFRVKVIYIEISYLQAATPHTSYGTVGGLSLYVNPVMRLNESEQWRCEHDFDEIRYRVEHPHQYFHGDEMLAALQILFVDFFEFHSRIYGEVEVSASTANTMKGFVAMLERGDYRFHREVAYYAFELCVTPKYLSEICKKLSGNSANFWINRYAAIELNHLLHDKSLTFTEIADKFGFSSQSQFTRYVQNNLGAPPSSFRA